jgi:hypothetical protein
MRQESEFFEDQVLDLLVMARRLPEALRIEELLTDSGVEYCIETGPYVGGLLFRRELTGVFFYVRQEVLESSQQLLLKHRFKPYDRRTGR